MIRGTNNVNRVPVASFTPNTSTSFASTGSQLGPGSLTMESQVEIARSISREDFLTAAARKMRRKRRRKRMRRNRKNKKTFHFRPSDS